jgi:hypothetical protein
LANIWTCRSAACARYWRVWREKGRHFLAVLGYGGGEGKVTETFRCVRYGQAWRGRWNRFERNEVVLRPVQARRMQVVTAI